MNKLVRLDDTDIIKCENMINTFYSVHSVKSTVEYTDNLLTDVNLNNGSKFKYTIDRKRVRLYDENISQIMDLLIVENIDTPELLKEFIEHGRIPSYITLQYSNIDDWSGVVIGVNLDVKGKIK